MNSLIDVTTLVNNIDKYIIIDVRSPKEYEDGTINGAVNIPILDNEAREFVGTLYKNNQREAYRKGLEIASSKLLSIYDKVTDLKKTHPDKNLLFFCFRGGSRSKSVQTIISLLKVQAYRLEGGYKAYRKYILEELPNYLDKVNWLVLTGNTGAGKTLVLKELITKGYPVIDLEGLANNRGSIFGSIGLGDKINQKVFDSNLFFQLKNYIDNGISNIFVESESRKVGNVILPSEMSKRMKESPHIMLNVLIRKRIEIIKDIYDPKNIDKSYIANIINNNEHFLKRLGREWINDRLDEIKQSNYDNFIKKMLLDYYDKLYYESHRKYQYDIIIESDNKEDIVEKLIKYYKTKISN